MNKWIFSCVASSAQTQCSTQCPYRRAADSHTLNSKQHHFMFMFILICWHCVLRLFVGSTHLSEKQQLKEKLHLCTKRQMKNSFEIKPNKKKNFKKKWIQMRKKCITVISIITSKCTNHWKIVLWDAWAIHNPHTHTIYKHFKNT